MDIEMNSVDGDRSIARINVCNKKQESKVDNWPVLYS